MSLISTEISALRSLDLKTVSVDDLKPQLSDLLVAALINRRELSGGMLWRARATEWGQRIDAINEIWYPPADKIRTFGRANNIGKPVFYCSDHPGTAVMETKGPRDGPFTIMACGLKDGGRPPIVIPLGLGRSLPQGKNQAGAQFTQSDLPPLLESRTGQLHDEAAELQAFLREEFTKIVPPGAEYLYKITVAISEMLLESQVKGGPPTDGLVYAPVSAAVGTNIVLSARAADELMYPLACWVVITTADKGVLYLFRSRTFRGDRGIEWEEPEEPQPFFAPERSDMRNIFEELKLEGLTQEQKDQILVQLTDSLLKRLVLRVYDKLTDKEQEEFDKLTDEGDAEKINSFLEKKIPEFEEIKNAEVNIPRQSRGL